MWRLRQLLRRIVAEWRSRQVERRWARHLERLPQGADGKILLHIGCGDIDAPGFVNLDARPQPHVHIVTTNLFKLSMIPDGAVDLIYMSHVLEHVSHLDVVSAMREFRRILRPDGVLRVSARISIIF